jgi:hypothetical protein
MDIGGNTSGISSIYAQPGPIMMPPPSAGNTGGGGGGGDGGYGEYNTQQGGGGGGETVVETGDMEAGMTMEVVVGVVLCERTSWRIGALG